MNYMLIQLSYWNEYRDIKDLYVFHQHSYGLHHPDSRWWQNKNDPETDMLKLIYYRLKALSACREDICMSLLNTKLLRITTVVLTHRSIGPNASGC